MKAMKTLPILLGVLLLASPALATKGVSCDKVRAALDGGKSQQQVAKAMKISVDHVKHCTAQGGSSAK